MKLLKIECLALWLCNCLLFLSRVFCEGRISDYFEGQALNLIITTLNPIFSPTWLIIHLATQEKWKLKGKKKTAESKHKQHSLAEWVSPYLSVLCFWISDRASCKLCILNIKDERRSQSVTEPHLSSWDQLCLFKLHYKHLLMHCFVLLGV